MKLEFDRMANGGYVIDLKANSDFNLHLERMSNEEDVYIYVRGSSEGEYKFYKKVFGKVVDMDFDIPEAIVPKYYRIKTSVAPTLCEVTGDVENVTGQEVKPEGGVIYNELLTYSDDSDFFNALIDLTNKTTDASFVEFTEDEGLPAINLFGRNFSHLNLSPVADITVKGYYNSYNWESVYRLGAINGSYRTDITLGDLSYSAESPSKIKVRNNISGFEYIIIL